MKSLVLSFLTSDLVSAALQLDQLCLGGLWTLDGYQRELDSPNSDLLILQRGFVQSAPKPDPESALLGIACLWAIADEAHITLLAVHPHYRRHGLGQTLLHAMLNIAVERRLAWATLEVRVSNQAAINLYRKFDFQTVGQRRRYYQDTDEDALILWHSGLQNPDFIDKLQRWDQQINRHLSEAGWQLQTYPALAKRPEHLDSRLSL